MNAGKAVAADQFVDSFGHDAIRCIACVPELKYFRIDEFNPTWSIEYLLLGTGDEIERGDTGMC